MAVCPWCRYDNPDTAEICENPDCRRDLRVAPAAGPSVDGPAPSGGDPAGGQRKGVRITGDPLQLTVQPGLTPGTATVVVHNRGTRVEHFAVTVEGAVAAFAQVSPPALKVLPNKNDTAEVRFVVPREPRPHAGHYSFQVVARASVDSDVSARVLGGLTVGRFDLVSAVVDPAMSAGRRPGLHRVTVTNRGNAAVDAQVAMADQQGDLTFEPPKFGGRLGPGASSSHDVTVGAPITWFGRTRAIMFTGRVSTDGRESPAVVHGLRRQMPWLPWWVPTAALTALALVVALLALRDEPTVPGVARLERVAAETTLKEAGYQVVPIEKPDPEVPVDHVIATKPEQGSVLREGERIQMFISQGSCPAGCLVPVPAVEGLTVAEAQEDLTAAGVVDRTRSTGS